VTTGKGESMIARMIERIEVSSPPGVSMRRTTTSAPAAAASSIDRPIRSLVAGPIGPSTGTTWTSDCASARAIG
jgi:hypothetical protein